MLYTGVVPVFRWPSFPETIPAGALAEPPGFTVLSGDVLGLIGAGPLIFTRSDLLRSLLKPSQQTSVDLLQITATSLSVWPLTLRITGTPLPCENTRAAWQFFFTART